MFGYLIEKDSENKIEQNLDLEIINAPVSKGQKVGKITYSMDGTLLGNVNLISAENVDNISFFSVTKSIIYNWINLLRSQ